MLPEPNKSVWGDLQGSAPDFYTKAAAEKRGGSDLLLQLDPLDLGDANIAKAVAETTDRILLGCNKHGAAPGPARLEAIKALAARMVNVDRYVGKGAGSEPLVYLKDWYRSNAIISLFPAYIETRIQEGLLQTSLVPDLVFADETVDSYTAVATYNSTPAEARSLKLISEGAELPEAEITAADSTINLRKFGRQVKWSYESTQGNARLSMVEHHLRRAGQQVGIDETDLLLHTFIAGDGTTAGAAVTNSTDVEVAVAGTITFADMLSWYFNVPDSAYRLDKAIGGKTDISKIADLAEFSDVEYLRGQDALRIPTPAAMNYYWWDGGVTGSAYVNRLVIGIDSTRAALAHTFGGFVQESDRIITRQVYVATMAYWRGFRKFDADAVQVLDCNNAL